MKTKICEHCGQYTAFGECYICGAFVCLRCGLVCSDCGEFVCSLCSDGDVCKYCG